MPNFLDRLRAKPPHFRRAVALTVVTAVVGLIFIMWLTALLPKIGNSQSSEIGKENSREGTPRPFSALTEHAKRMFEGGTRVLTDFMELGEPIEYVQEEKLPNDASGLLKGSGEIIE